MLRTIASSVIIMVHGCSSFQTPNHSFNILSIPQKIEKSNKEKYGLRTYFRLLNSANFSFVYLQLFYLLWNAFNTLATLRCVLFWFA